MLFANITDQQNQEKTFIALYYLNINPVVPNAPFLYPLKASENCKVFWCFYEVEKGGIGNEWIKDVTKMKKLQNQHMSKDKYRKWNNLSAANSKFWLSQIWFLLWFTWQSKITLPLKVYLGTSKLGVYNLIHLYTQ